MKTHKKLAILAVLAGMVSTPVYAQDLRSASEGVVACQSVEDTAERLACFEAAAQQLSTALALPQPQIVQAPTAASATGAVTAPIQQATTSTTTTAAAPVQMASAETAPSAESPPTGPPKRRLLPSWVPTVSLSIGGGDSVEEPDFFDTEITRIQRNKIGRHFFTTSDGQVWRQIQIEKIRAPATLPANATLRQTLSGSIRLEIEENGRSYPVNRVE